MQQHTRGAVTRRKRRNTGTRVLHAEDPRGLSTMAQAAATMVMRSRRGGGPGRRRRPTPAE
jgi:hypothetical protein